jgi:hypothetical protein
MIILPEGLKAASRAIDLTPERSQHSARGEMTRLSLLGIVWLPISLGPGALFGREETLIVWEMFKVYGGQIDAVEAFMEATPVGTAFGTEL